MTKLAIRRAKAAWQDRMRSYRVLVDGREAAQIENGAEIEIPINPGKHVVHLEIDWCRSEAQEIDVANGGTQVLECGPNSTPWLALVYVIFLRHKYLWLRRAASPSDLSLQGTT